MRRVALDAAALGATLAEWRAHWPTLSVLALLPEAEAPRLPVLQTACREAGVALAGGIFPQLIDGDRLVSDGVWLLAHETPLPAFLLPDLPADAEAAATQMADAVDALLDRTPAAEPPTLYLVFDGQLGHIGSVLDGLYLRLADGVRYAGVNAGSERFVPLPCLFDAERVVSGGVLGVLLPPVARTVLAHDYPVPRHVRTATSTQGNRIAMIDWRPAFEVYRELVREHDGVELTRENFYTYAVHFPLGILRATGDVLVRIPVALDDDGALTCIGEVPEHAMLVVLQAPDADHLHCVDTLALELGDPARGQDTLLFYCAGRRMHLGAAVSDELAQLRDQLHTPVLAGALSLGEVGNADAWGYPMFHNAALVCTVWAGR